MKKPIKQLPTFAWRTYRGGAMIKDYLGIAPAEDTFYPEDWISSFVEAKNKNYVENEGITRVLYDDAERLITEVVTPDDFGEGRTDSGVLIKFLDAAERLGIQVHPTKEYARKIFNSSYGKTECWHILGTRNMGEPAVIYLGFKEHVTKELWKELFEKQDINGMLEAMHRFEVKSGDTVLVTGGTPHAIGAGCFLLEIQEPSDYTMRTEKVTVAGDTLTPMQIHYGVGEEKMLDCFDYTPTSREEIQNKFFLKPRQSATPEITSLVTYNDTPCFALEQIKCDSLTLKKEHFITVIATKKGGSIKCDGEKLAFNRGDKYFIPANTEITLVDSEVLVCYPPKSRCDNMINSRKTLFDAAYNMYKSLMTRTAERYYSNEPYVVSDYISFSCTRVEELFRPLWGIAPFLKNGDIEITVRGEATTVSQFITAVMLEGTKQDGEKAFDRDVTEFNKIVFANQTITEIAAYMVAVCFAPEKLWKPLSRENKDQIALWIKKWAICALKNSWKNNHYWYPVFCIEILKKLGYDLSEADADMQKGYEVLESFYVGKGWYCDGAFGRFDYYEAWAHHTYPLLWILLTDLTDEKNKKRAEEYKKRSTQFLNFFINYFDSDGGMAAYGRSLGYRFGCIAPFGLAALTGCNIDFGLAKRVILKNINYFFEKSIPTKDGIFPCGYLYESPSFAENYASDGAISCYTEGFMCLLADENHPLWQAEESPLPIERGDYTVQSELDGLELVITGENDANGVTLYNNSVHYYQNDFFGHRFNDMAGYYSKFAYNSRAGFGISVTDNPSLDNMISLYTPDGRMVSHRQKIEENYIENGVMVSTHTPFSNDAETKIKTYLLPLKDGWHLRVHKVKLSQPYIVCEGGFSVGIRDDGFKIDENRITYGKIQSQIIVKSTVEVSYDIHRIHPGMHLLQPQALYPVYKTEVLEKGEYIFATLICFTTDGNIQTSPEVIINNDAVTVNQGDFLKIIEVG